MPVEKERFDPYSDKQYVCPECGGRHVTPLDNPDTPKPTTIAVEGGPEEVTYSNVCWDCEWEEKVTVTFERVRS